MVAPRGRGRCRIHPVVLNLKPDKEESLRCTRLPERAPRGWDQEEREARHVEAAMVVAERRPDLCRAAPFRSREAATASFSKAERVMDKKALIGVPAVKELVITGAELETVFLVPFTAID